MSLEAIEWGVQPPNPGSNVRTGSLVVTEVLIAAKMRPGVWGRYEFGTTTQAATYAVRMRGKGLEATARGLSVYFRWPK